MDKVRSFGMFQSQDLVLFVRLFHSKGLLQSQFMIHSKTMLLFQVLIHSAGWVTCCLDSLSHFELSLI